MPNRSQQLPAGEGAGRECTSKTSRQDLGAMTATVLAPSPDLSKDLWGPREVAAYLELAPNTVYSMLARGEVPGQIRFGRHWKISVPALMRAIHGEAGAA